MVNLDSITNKNNKKWSYIPNYFYIILIIYLYAKDLSEYEILIKTRKDAGIKHLNDPNAFIKRFNTMDDIYENINDYHPSKKNLIVFDDIITDIMTNKKFQAIINELLIRCKKINISLVPA